MLITILLPLFAEIKTYLFWFYAKNETNMLSKFYSIKRNMCTPFFPQWCIGADGQNPEKRRRDEPGESHPFPDSGPGGGGWE